MIMAILFMFCRFLNLYDIYRVVGVHREAVFSGNCKAISVGATGE